MASAKSETITRLVSTDEAGITLRLSNDEALHLIAVCRRIGGLNGHRHVFSDRDDSILEQLCSTGLPEDGEGTYSQFLSGHLVFSDEPQSRW